MGKACFHYPQLQAVYPADPNGYKAWGASPPAAQGEHSNSTDSRGSTFNCRGFKAKVINNRPRLVLINI